MPRASLLHLESSIDHATRPSRASDGTGTISQLSKTSFIVSGQRAAFLACIFDSVSVSCACRSKTRRDRCRAAAKSPGVRDSDSSIATYTDMGPDTTAYHIFHFKLTCFSPALRSLTRSPASIRSDQVPGQVRHGHRCSPHHQTRFESTCALPRRPGCAHSAHGRNRVR